MYFIRCGKSSIRIDNEYSKGENWTEGRIKVRDDFKIRNDDFEGEKIEDIRNIVYWI